MAEQAADSRRAANRRIWGWFFFDWASQPYNTLLLTFIFGPYIAVLLGDGTAAQSVWGFGIGAAGFMIAIMAPILGAIADRTGSRMGWIWLFSGAYFVGALALWWSEPGNFNLLVLMVFFGIGLIGMEFATIFTNAMLPDLGTREEIGRLSGSGWAFGYVGGVISLAIMLLFFAEGPGGKTLIGLAPAFGLDPTRMEGTRFVGPFTALWFAVFMIPFFLWVREPRPHRAVTTRQAAAEAIPELAKTLKSLPERPSLLAFLMSSMLYRDALNGMYVFGGIYAAGVLGWPVQMTGIFGILAAITGAIFAWLGGRADAKYGPKPVIVICVSVLALVALSIVFISRDAVLGIPVGEGSRLPDIAFFVLGAAIGAAGGSLQAASRTMMVRQAEPERMTEAFGLYALAGKATSFIAPLSIGIVTALTGSQHAGIVPLIVIFLAGLILLRWVDPEGAAPR